MIFKVGIRIVKLRIKQGIPNSILSNNLFDINAFLYMLGFLGSKVQFCNLNVKRDVE